MGNAIAGKKGFQPIALADRFWAKVKKTEGCWLWTGAVVNATYPYGQLWVDGRHQLAHRIALALAGRVIPDGTEVDHLCRVPRCVRPSHLDTVSHAENNRRGWAAIKKARGE